jgi:hypothetical protein
MSIHNIVGRPRLWRPRDATALDIIVPNNRGEAHSSDFPWTASRARPEPGEPFDSGAANVLIGAKLPLVRGQRSTGFAPSRTSASERMFGLAQGSNRTGAAGAGRDISR